MCYARCWKSDALRSIMIEPARRRHVAHRVAQAALNTRIGVRAVDCKHIKQDHLSRFELNPNGAAGVEFALTQGLRYKRRPDR